MPSDHVEPLRRGFHAVVYAGKDPITGRKTYLVETHPTREGGAVVELVHGAGRQRRAVGRGRQQFARGGQGP